MKTLFVLLTFITFVAVATDTKGADTNTVSSTVVTSTPGSANSPSVVVNNSNICKTAVVGAVQTQIFGISQGITVTDSTCELLLLASKLYQFQMKVGAVTLLASEPRVFDALWNAGTYAPVNINGESKIGNDARDAWLDNVHLMPEGSLVKARLLKEKENEIVIRKEDNHDLEKFLFMAMAMYIGMPILF